MSTKYKVVRLSGRAMVQKSQDDEPDEYLITRDCAHELNELQAKVDRLSARGIEDMKFEIKELNQEKSDLIKWLEGSIEHCDEINAVIVSASYRHVLNKINAVNKCEKCNHIFEVDLSPANLCRGCFADYCHDQ